MSQTDQRRVLHRRVQDDLARVEQHGKALARALSMPDDATTLVPGGPRRLDRRVDGPLNRVELVVSGNDLDEQVAIGVVLKDDEVPKQRQKPVFLEDPANQDFKLQDRGGDSNSPSIVRHGLNHSAFAVNDPTRACRPSETIIASL